MKRTLREMFAADEYCERYVTVYGDRYAFDRWLEAHFTVWTAEEFPPQQASPPVLDEEAVQDLLDQYREFWTVREVPLRELPRIAVDVLVAGCRAGAWELDAIPGVLTPSYWGRVWNIRVEPAPNAGRRAALRVVGRAP